MTRNSIQNYEIVGEEKVEMVQEAPVATVVVLFIIKLSGTERTIIMTIMVIIRNHTVRDHMDKMVIMEEDRRDKEAQREDRQVYLFLHRRILKRFIEMSTVITIRSDRMNRKPVEI